MQMAQRRRSLATKERDETTRIMHHSVIRHATTNRYVDNYFSSSVLFLVIVSKTAQYSEENYI
jgi:hypothetical protein